jgi:hypothetical protein
MTIIKFTQPITLQTGDGLVVRVDEGLVTIERADLRFVTLEYRDTPFGPVYSGPRPLPAGSIGVWPVVD